MQIISDTPQFLPQAALQQILDADRASTQLDKYKDNKGRLMWSCPWGGGPIITYYLYNDEGNITEIGESWMNTGARFSLHCLRGYPEADHREYLFSRPRLDNVRRLAPEAETQEKESQEEEPITEQVTPALPGSLSAAIPVPAMAATKSQVAFPPAALHSNTHITHSPQHSPIRCPQPENQLRASTFGVPGHMLYIHNLAGNTRSPVPYWQHIPKTARPRLAPT